MDMLQCRVCLQEFVAGNCACGASDRVSEGEQTQRKLRLDFAGGDLSRWHAEGEAFREQPVRGDRFRASQVKPGLVPLGGDYWDGPYPVGQRGEYWISTEDHLTGTLTSETFILEASSPWFTCLLGGSDVNDACSISLLIKASESNSSCLSDSYSRIYIARENSDFFQVFQATSRGHEMMRRVVFYAQKFVGEWACVRISDSSISEHINVADVCFSAEAPLTLETEAGEIDPDAPVWGYADLHTHPMAHLAFGGVIFWGQPDGPVDEAMAKCVKAHGIAGTGIAGRHSSILMSFFEQIGYGINVGHLVGGYPQFDGWPRFTTLVHQQMYIDWIRRAFDGGLRLLVAHAVNNEMLANSYNGQEPYDDKSVVERQIEAMKELAARYHDWMEIAYTPTEARRIIHQNKLAIVLGVEVDSLGNWKQPQLPTEEEISTYLAHLYHNLGVRHLFPVHMADNIFSGSAIYYDLFSLVNHHLHKDYFEVEDGSVYGIEYRLQEDPGLAIDIARVMQGYNPPYRQVSGGHMNGKGLTELGHFLLCQMMSLGMLIEVDHMSHKAVEATLDLVEQYDYPVVAGHTGFRELALKRNEETACNQKCASEGLKTASQIERIAKLGGIVGPLACQADVREVGEVIPSLQGKVRGDCAGSSKSWAQAYLYAVEKMGGRGVGFGTDTNGFAKFNAPRFGLNASYFLDYDVPGMGRDPRRRSLRREQVEAQGNGVRYDEPLANTHHYRFEGVLEGDVYDGLQRDVWQAIGLYKAGCDPWKSPNILNYFNRAVHFAKGFFALDDAQLERPGLLTGNEPWEQRVAFLVKTGQEPGTTERDPQPVHEMYPRVMTIWRRWEQMEGDNPPLKRCYTGERDFDINLDGVAHYGLLPDLLQDLKNVGLTHEDLIPLFRSAEDYIRTWEKCDRRSRAIVESKDK
ncbi:peptidase M19 renal dipeptidase [Ktedonobacter racemifer DSM 44963]|uniref:Peptidase M19 renal dipeptidase n=2 Tax=Ktedonobacter racemifer TaxID=363277 RepID=D6TZW6_KTERA|nr:peptidase M19 renal dipeptidase [Ktedonobacter racemifer DSM 44963]